VRPSAGKYVDGRDMGQELPPYDDLFQPVLDALNALGGSATPAQVQEYLAKSLNLSDSALEITKKDGTSLFSNRVQWARLCLSKAGYIGSSKRGVWSLTEKGRVAHIDKVELRASMRRASQIAEPRQPETSRVVDAQVQALPDVKEDGHASTALDAVRRVLAEAKEPLHYKEITRRILKQGYWETHGKTPEATINAQIAVSIKHHGSQSPFRRVGRGTFELNSSTMPASPDAIKTPETQKRKAKQTSGKLSFTDAAEHVLRRFGNRRPMHYRDITTKALEQGLVSTSGLTPEATMYAQIIQENQRYSRRGERPRFERYGRGIVGLSAWHGEGLAYKIEEHNRDVRRRFRKQLQTMPPCDFEGLIGRLLVAIGFDEVEVTARQGDGGIDVRGTLVVGEVIRTRMAVQVKRWRKNVQAPVVQQVRGSLGTHEQGLIVTTSDFSSGACTEAERPDAIPVALMNGEQLVSLLVENKICVAKKSYELIELGENAEEHE
jgi:restriction system protein